MTTLSDLKWSDETGDHLAFIKPDTEKLSFCISPNLRRPVFRSLLYLARRQIFNKIDLKL